MESWKRKVICYLGPLHAFWILCFKNINPWLGMVCLTIDATAFYVTVGLLFRKELEGKIALSFTFVPLCVTLGAYFYSMSSKELGILLAAIGIFSYVFLNWLLPPLLEKKPKIELTDCDQCELEECGECVFVEE